MSDEDISLDEKRVFEERRGTAHAFVASEIGLARVAVSDDQIGRFGLVHRGEVRDVAVDGLGAADDADEVPDRTEAVAVATDEDVLVGDGETFEPTAFGPAVAVSFADGPGAATAAVAAPVAAGPDGRIARRDGDEWSTVGVLDGAVAALDGDLVATATGVRRVDANELAALGLTNVRDVAADGPFAATGEGVFRRVDGDWHRETAGDATAVASREGRSVAVVGGEVVERDEAGWQSSDCPVAAVENDGDGVADLAIGRSTYAIAGDGTLFVDPPTAKDGAAGWASRSLGLTGVAGIAVLDPSE